LDILGAEVINFAIFQTQFFNFGVLAESDRQVLQSLSAKAIVIELQFDDWRIMAQHFPQELATKHGNLVVQQIKILNGLGLFNIVANGTNSFIFCFNLPQTQSFKMFVTNL
jgi:hypothetical protein